MTAPCLTREETLSAVSARTKWASRPKMATLRPRVVIRIERIGVFSFLACVRHASVEMQCALHSPGGLCTCGVLTAPLHSRPPRKARAMPARAGGLLGSVNALIFHEIKETVCGHQRRGAPRALPAGGHRAHIVAPPMSCPRRQTGCRGKLLDHAHGLCVSGTGTGALTG